MGTVFRESRRAGQWRNLLPRGKFKHGRTVNKELQTRTARNREQVEGISTKWRVATTRQKDGGKNIRNWQANGANESKTMANGKWQMAKRKNKDMDGDITNFK